MKTFVLILALLVLLVCCTKEQGKNPELAYSTHALLDSCLKTDLPYYKNDPNTLLSGAHGPHGTFKLRFNSIAFNALTDNGKLPAGAVFPEGSLIVKDIYKGTSLEQYAYMYKRAGSWLWAEAKPDRSIQHGVNDNVAICSDCHSQNGNRDFAVSFNFY